MPEYLSPGVYVEEIEIGGKPIEGVSTSTAGFLGPTERGPETPTLITGFEQFRRLYGGYLDPNNPTSPMASRASLRTAGSAALSGGLSLADPAVTRHCQRRGHDQYGGGGPRALGQPDRREESSGAA